MRRAGDRCSRSKASCEHANLDDCRRGPAKSCVAAGGWPRDRATGGPKLIIAAFERPGGPSPDRIARRLAPTEAGEFFVLERFLRASKSRRSTWKALSAPFSPGFDPAERGVSGHIANPTRHSPGRARPADLLARDPHAHCVGSASIIVWRLDWPGRRGTATWLRSRGGYGRGESDVQGTAEGLDVVQERHSTWTGRTREVGRLVAAIVDVYGGG